MAQTPFANAFAFGLDKPFIVVHSAVVDMLEKDELQALIAHELGHIMSNHMLYYSILTTLTNLLSMGGLGIPFGNLAIYAFIAALFEWFRKAELTCDRAGLLVAQNLETCYRLKMKFSGGRRIDQMSIEEFFKQADEYDRHGDIIDSVYKILNNWQATHPHSVSRMRELQRWHDKGNYNDILKGDYITRDSEKHADMAKTWSNAFKNIKKDIDESGDNLAKIMSDLLNTGESIFNYGSEFVRSIFRGGAKDK